MIKIRNLVLYNDSYINESEFGNNLYFRAFAEYNRDQYIPTKIHGTEKECLITDANDLGDSRFYDPRTRQSFKYVNRQILYSLT